MFAADGELRLVYLAYEMLREGQLRVVEELFGGAFLVNHAFGEEEHAAADLTGKTHLVGDNNHRHALPCQTRDDA